MTDANPSPHFSKPIGPPSGAAIETFSDLLADAPNLEGVCLTALQFALETIGHSGGVFVAQTLPEKEPACWVQSNLPQAWMLQLEDPSSPMRKVIQEVLQSGQYIIGDHLTELTNLTGLAAAIPILARSGVQGVLLVEGAVCSPVEVDWLLKLSRPMGRAIRMSRAGSVDQQRTQELLGLQETLNDLSFSADLERMQVQLLQGVSRLLEAEQSILIMIDEAGAEWMTRKALDEQSNWIYQVETVAGSGLLRECLRSQQVLRVGDVGADARFNPLTDTLPGLQAKSIVFVPLMANGRMLGAIQALNKRQGSFDAIDQDVLVFVANLASNALFGARLLQRMNIADADREADRWELVNARSILSAMLGNLPGYMYVIGREYELVVQSASMGRRARLEGNALPGKVCYQALYQRSEPCLGCMVADTFKSGRETLRTAGRATGKTSEADSTWEIRSFPIFDGSSHVIQAILFEQDITERRELEAVVAQTGKLAALGQLAAGVAHEINNPLTAIIANAQILQRELPPGDERLESVELISMAGARAAQVVRNLLDFARKEQAQRVLTNINDTLRSSLALVQHELLSHSITLQFEPEVQLPLILAAPDSLQGVWLNLLLNSVESIDKAPGVIRLASRRVGDEVHVTISDNGRGIPAERLERIFEPFYTTKAPGRGTGLGLSVCNRIVEQHNGRISVESQLGKGTVFVVALPIA
jgi:two-component system, NtrC family, sensor kinase